MASVVGVCTLGGVVMLSGIRRTESKTNSPQGGIETGAVAEMRPVLMACAAAGLGLLPGAISTGIGAQAQQPLARVVVGGMVTSPLAILFLLPVLASFFLKARTQLGRNDLHLDALANRNPPVATHALRCDSRCILIAHAEVAELADAPALGAGGRKAVGVRVPSSALPLLYFSQCLCGF